MKYWEIIADNLKRRGWSWGCISAVDSNGLTIWIANAHRDDGKRFVVRADEKLTAFELEAATRGPCAENRHVLSLTPAESKASCFFCRSSRDASVALRSPPSLQKTRKEVSK